jgi:hypothetical protein
MTMKNAAQDIATTTPNGTFDRRPTARADAASVFDIKAAWPRRQLSLGGRSATSFVLTNFDML